jgi:hypothetical protein
MWNDMILLTCNAKKYVVSLKLEDACHFASETLGTLVLSKTLAKYLHEE